jgi:hypothetical protein
MKSKDLHTTYDLIARDYTMTKLPNGLYRHTFSPQTTSTVYEFEANGVAMMENGKHYNVGYTPLSNGRNLVETSTISLGDQVNPMLSYLAAQNYAQQKYAEERAKNDRRVTHNAQDKDYYWGRKYAWRMYGAFMADDAFLAYLDERGHKSVPCTTIDPDYPSINTLSTAYSDVGLEQASLALINAATRINPTSTFYRAAGLYSKKFTIRGINAISHKK